MASSEKLSVARLQDQDSLSYDDVPPKYRSGSTLSSSPYKRLPLAFNIYYKQWFSSMYQLGEHENQPLFTIQRRGGWGHDEPMIVLHEGADHKGPVVGTVTKEALMKHETVIALPGCSRHGSKAKTIRERLDCDLSLKNSRFTFSVDVRRGKEQCRESFEWRPSKGIEVQSLDSMAFGWKLVRLGPDQPKGQGGRREVRNVGEASDGKEVVAAWSENSAMTLSKIAKFHFLGAGASDEFGEEWALMAVLSAFRLWKFTSASISVRP